MIYHRFGSPVKKVISINETKAQAVVVYADDPTEQVEVVQLADLKADGGIQEILDAVS